MSVERGSRQAFGILDQALVVAAPQPASPVLEDRLPRDLGIIRGVLGLSVPGQWLTQAAHEGWMPSSELLVHRHEAHEAAHAAFGRRVQAEQPHELGCQGEPRRVGVELKIQVRHRAPHAVAQSLARVPDVVQHGAVPLLRHEPSKEAAQEPAEGPVLLQGEALDGKPIEHGQPDPVTQLPSHAGQDVATAGEAELVW